MRCAVGQPHCVLCTVTCVPHLESTRGCVQRLLAALMTQGQGIQKLHVAVGNQIKRLQVGCLRVLRLPNAKTWQSLLLSTHLTCSQTACARQCEEQCLLDMLRQADAAVACGPAGALGPGTAPDADDRAGEAGAAPATGTDVIVCQHTGAALASAAVLPGANSPVRSAADAGAAAGYEPSSIPVSDDGVRAGHSNIVALSDAALPGTHDGYAGDCTGGSDRRAGGEGDK